MILRELILAGLLLAGWWAPQWGMAQSSTTRTYTLLSKSQLTDDCPICDRIPIVVPLRGTFELRFLDEDPLFTRYELLNVSFHAGTAPGPEYTVTGNGIYQVGGEVAVVQSLFLDAEINNGFSSTNALCTSTNGPVRQKWPRLEIEVDQTNGTPSQVYYLAIVAVPDPQLRVSISDVQAGDVRLDWDENGGSFQLERASSAGGPYSPVTAITTKTSFTDSGVLRNHARQYYRLLLF